MMTYECEECEALTDKEAFEGLDIGEVCSRCGSHKIVEKTGKKASEP